MDIINMMKSYLEKKATIRFREMDIEALRNKLQYQNKTYIEDTDSAIEGMVMKAKTVSDMPVSVTNKFHSSTEDAAFSYERERVYSNTFDVEDIKSKIRALEIEIEPLKIEVAQVEIFLQGLTERERFIAEKFYIHGWTWEEVTYYYNEKMPVTRQKWALKDVKNNLIHKIERIAGISA